MKGRKTLIVASILIISLVLLSTVTAVYTQTIVKNQCEGKEGTSEYASNTFFTFYTNKSAIGDGTLTLSLKGFYEGSLAYAFVNTEDDENIIKLPEDGESYPSCTCQPITKTVTITKEQINRWKADGKIEFTVIQGDVVYCLCGAYPDTYYCNCGDTSQCTNMNMITIEYPTGSLPMQTIMKILGLIKTD